MRKKAETEDIKWQKNTKFDTSDLVRNEEKSLADNTTSTVTPISTLYIPSQECNRSEFWRTGRLSRNRVSALKGISNLFALIFLLLFWS